MKRMVKNITLIIIVGILLSTSVYAADNMVEKHTPEGVADNVMFDIIGTEYEEAVSLLTKLDILRGDEENLYNPDSDLTRAEAAATIIRLLGLEDISDSYKNKTFYTDISKDSWYVGVVNLATELKIVNGYGNNIFEPEAPVKYEEFVKMLVSAIGHDVVAESRGGYPYGYITVANDRGITKGSPMKIGENIKRGPVAIYMFNSLFVELLSVRYTNGEREYLSGGERQTLIQSVFEVEEQRGIIIANEDTGLNTAMAATREGIVKVSVSNTMDVLYDVGYTNAKELIGYDTRIYVQDVGIDTKKIVSIIPDTINRTLTIDSKDIIKLSNRDDYVEIEYSKADNYANNMSESIDLFASVIYNQASLGTISNIAEDELEDIIMPKSGEVVLLDNNGDGNIDVIFVTEYENYVINRVNVQEGKIILKNNSRQRGEIEIKRFSRDRTAIIKDNIEIGIEELEENQVLTLVESRESANQKRTLYISDNMIEGMIDELEENIDYKYVRVNGEKYLLSHDVNRIPSVGSEGWFYMNVRGEIVYVDNYRSTRDNYAYLIDVHKGKGSLGYVEVQIVTDSGDTRVIPVKSRLSYNGNTVVADVMFEELNGKSQLIKYEINRDEEISKVETAGELAQGTRYDETRFVMNASNADTTGFNEGLYFKAGVIPRIGGLYAIPSDCVVFFIPEKDSSGNYNVEDIRVAKDTKSLVNDIFYIFEIFDVDKNMNASAIVSYGIDTERSTEGSLRYNENILVIDRITQIIDENGELRSKLYGLKEGKEMSELIAVEPKDVVNRGVSGDIHLNRLINLKRGSIIQYKINTHGELSEYRILFKPEPIPGEAEEAGVTAPGEKRWGTGLINTNELIGIRGSVDAMDDNIVVITWDGGQGTTTTTLRTLAIPDNVDIYVYDKMKDEIMIGSKADIIAGYGRFNSASSVFARIYKDELCELMVLK